MKTPMENLLDWVRENFPMDMDLSLKLEAKILIMLDEEEEYIAEQYAAGTAEGIKYVKHFVKNL